MCFGVVVVFIIVAIFLDVITFCCCYWFSSLHYLLLEMDLSLFFFVVPLCRCSFVVFISHVVVVFVVVVVFITLLAVWKSVARSYCNACRLCASSAVSAATAVVVIAARCCCCKLQPSTRQLSSYRKTVEKLRAHRYSV